MKSSKSSRSSSAFRAREWNAIHLALIAAAHALRNGQSDLTAIARWSVQVAEGAGYETHADQRLTRFMGLGITRFQTLLYAMNDRRDWRFPDPVLLVGWLLEGGGPAMGRGPAKADYAANGVSLMIGGTRWRYNNGRYGHGRENLPESREYLPADCSHMNTASGL
jgi:hypothetical protein